MPRFKLMRPETSKQAMPTPLLVDAALPMPGGAGEVLRLGKAYGAAAALAIAEISAREKRQLVVLTRSVADAEILSQELAFFIGADADLALFPDLEALPYDPFSPHQDLIAERLRVLRRLDGSTPFTLLTAASTLLNRLPPVEHLKRRSIQLATGDTLDQETFRQMLDDRGYQRVAQTSIPGDYAVRGSLVDFFPGGHPAPVRVDFFDDRIESLREFDPDSQTSTGTIDRIDTLPAREIALDADSITRFRQRFRRRFEGNPAHALVYREVSERRFPGGIENYLPLFFEKTASLWDYLPANSLIVTLETPEDALDTNWRQVEERYEQMRDDPDRPALTPTELFVPPDEHRRQLAARGRLELVRFELPTEETGPASRNLEVAAGAPILISRHLEEPSSEFRKFLKNRPKKVLFAAECRS